jgi:hypothetical protein
MTRTSDAHPDLTARVARVIVAHIDDDGMDIREASVAAARTAQAEGLALGWTPAQAHAIGEIAAEIGAELAAEAALQVRDA